MSESEKEVLLQIEDGVAQVILNRPEAANSINVALARELMSVMHQCADDPQVRVVLLRGAGKRFCVGGDLSGISEAGDKSPAYVRELLVYLHEALATMDRMSAPVIAAVHGNAAGAGFSLACACDIVIATESTKFLAAYTKIGLSPDGSLSWFLPRIVGLSRALDLLITNRELDARTAEQWGIVSRVVADDKLLDAALELTRSLATGPTRAFGSAKRLLRESLAETLHTQMFKEGKGLENALASADGREGLASFLQRRPAEFKG